LQAEPENRRNNGAHINWDNVQTAMNVQSLRLRFRDRYHGREMLENGYRNHILPCIKEGKIPAAVLRKSQATTTQKSEKLPSIVKTPSSASTPRQWLRVVPSIGETLERSLRHR
jgi:hypothetical protein